MAWFFLDYQVLLPYEDDLEKVYLKESTRGTFFLLEQELARHPEHEWKIRIKELEPQFSQPVFLREIRSLDLGQSERGVLEKGQILASVEDLTIYKAVPDSTFVLLLGTDINSRDFDREEVRLIDFEWGVYATIFVGSSIFILFWAYNLHRRSTRLNRIVKQFGSGALSLRAPDMGKDIVGQLAQGFNFMALKIEKLVTNQKLFTDGVAHDLRTPISRIQFDMELLRSGHLKDSDKERIGHIQADLDELTFKISELLDHSRISRDGFSAKLQKVEIIQWLQDQLKYYDSKENIHITFDHSKAGESFEVEMEADLMERAVQNLMENGFRFAEKRIVISVAKDGNFCKLSVEDDGPGVPLEEQEMVFEPYRRNSLAAGGDGGLGLGLALVNQISKAHGGTASVEDSHLGGACFSILWPTKA